MKALLYTLFFFLVGCAGFETSYKVGITSPDTGIIYGAEYTPRDWGNPKSKSKIFITAEK
jgi:hypothetical protein